MQETECGEGRSRGVLLIEKALEEFDKIILLDRKFMDQQLREAFYEEDNFKETDKRILILSERPDKKAGNIEWRRVEEEEAEDIIEIYDLYEFSNRIAIVARSQVFGSLWDYVDTGILTREEAVAAVLQ